MESQLVCYLLETRLDAVIETAMPLKMMTRRHGLLSAPEEPTQCTAAPSAAFTVD